MARGSVNIKDGFNALNQLRSMEPHEAVSPQVIHRRMSELIEGILDAGRDASERDAKDMAYALAALTDEVALSKAGTLEDYWRDNLLAVKFFDDTVAGEGFFRKLETLRRDHRRIEVLRVYYLCLLFGFQGIYLGRQEATLRKLTDSVASEVEQSLENGGELAPDGARPDDALLRRQEKRPLLWIALSALAVAASVYIGLRIVLDVQSGRVISRIQSLTETVRR